jgi:uncharacterized protein (TIGR02147 family)
MDTNTLDIFHFQNLKGFLKAYANHKKKTSPQWSYGVWAKQLQLGQTASLTRILSGERNPGKAIIDRFIDYFSFDHQRAEFFRLLGTLERAQNDPDLAALVIEKLQLLHPRGEFQYIDWDIHRSIAEWYFYCLIEMTRLPHFQECVDWIHDHILFDLSKAKIADALETLIRLQMLTRNENQQLLPSTHLRHTSRDVINLAARENLQQNLDLAKSAIEKVPVEEREFNTLVFCLKKNDLPFIKKFINQFCHNFCQQFDSTEADDVYIFQTQLFPYTTCKFSKEKSQ